MGLKCGLKRPINKFDTYVDVHRYMRKLSIKKYFLNKTSNPTFGNTNASVAVDSGLKNKSLFNPPNTATQHLDVFKGLVLRDMEKIIPKKGVNPQYIYDGIKKLEARKDVIVRPADKGGGVVILSKEFYINQITEMLSDEETYRKLDNDPTSRYNKELTALVYAGYKKNVLTVKEKRYDA